MKTFKHLFAIIAVAAAFVGCQQNGYKIKGTAEGLSDGDTLLLVGAFAESEGGDTIIVKNGKFEYSGETDSVSLCAIYSLATPGVGTDFLLEPGTITIDLSTEAGKTRVGGTKANEGWQKMNEMVAEYGQQMQQLTSKLMNSTPDSAQQRAAYEQMARLEYEMGQKVVEMTEKNLDNELGYFMVMNYINDQVFPAEKRLELLDKLPEGYRQRAAVGLMRRELQQSQQPAPEEGAKFGDYTLPTPDGGTLNLTEEVARHRYTVIDFWASWCGPCMREMPHMKQLYAKYEKLGMGLIGISLDEDRDAWLKAINEKQLSWLHVSDLQGWKCQPARDLGVEAIPCIYVLDQEGKIVAARLMGDDLERFLEQTFSSQQ